MTIPISEEELRTEFERMHKNRDLSRHWRRGTYLKPQIAALWNQHVKTARYMETRHQVLKDPVNSVD